MNRPSPCQRHALPTARPAKSTPCKKHALQKAGLAKSRPCKKKRGPAKAHTSPRCGARGTGWTSARNNREQPAAIGHAALGDDDHHLTVSVGETKGEDLRHGPGDLAWWKVDDGGNLPADQRGGLIMRGDLR